MGEAKKRKLKEKKAPEMPVLNPTAAGIDIGATEIYVAVHPDCDPEPVRSFATFTKDLHELADWLKACNVESVAMESTGVYWIPLFQILESRGFEVCLVNARYYRSHKVAEWRCPASQYCPSVGQEPVPFALDARSGIGRAAVGRLTAGCGDFDHRHGIQTRTGSRDLARVILP